MKQITLGSLFDGLYKVNKSGALYSSRTKKYLKPSIDRYGYLYYVISIQRKRFTLKAHRIVAEAFIPNEFQKPTVDHINGVRSDNRAENLRWATYKEQQKNPITEAKTASLHSTTDYYAMGKKRNFGRRRTAVYKSNELVDICETLTIAAKKYGANYAKASECANGKRKTAGGVRFCYV